MSTHHNKSTLSDAKETKMPPVLPFVGKSNSGKTTLMEKIIAELRQDGYRVGVVKHHGHATNIDQPGKDSWRHARAGAVKVVLSSPIQIALFAKINRELSLTEVVKQYLTDVDIVLVEGYKWSAYPKIEISRRERSTQLLCQPDELVAVVADHPVDVSGVPVFDLHDHHAITAFIIQNYLV